MGEFDLIDKYFKRKPARATLGVGDDCALIPFFDANESAPKVQNARFGAEMQLAVTTDMLVEGRHFFPGADPYRLGWKCLAVNLSDLAAMGAQPRYFTLSFALPDADEAWLAPFAAGLFAVADAHGIELIGGDTTKGPRTISITAMGEVSAADALRRSGAQAGDDIWVSHEIGGAALRLFECWGRTAIPEPARAHFVERMEQPQPRVALGRALRGRARAAIDISDGLVGDVRHIARASGLRAAISLEKIPSAQLLRDRLQTQERDLIVACLLAGGDDYELCFTAPKSERAAIAELLVQQKLNGGCVGEMVACEDGNLPDVTVRDATGRDVALPAAFDHFKTP